MNKRTTLHKLRTKLHPKVLAGDQAYAIAEQQALRFLKLTGCDSPTEITDAIAALPRFRVDVVPNLPSSGSSEWIDGHWQILLNADEPPVRQRFSLAHELKHVLDHPYIHEQHYSDTNQPGVGSAERRRHTEAVCDYFAGCLLVPRPWLKQAWADGTQNTDDLAKHFGVSRQAMTVRLSQTGLKTTNGRHSTAESLNRVFSGVRKRGMQWGSSLRHRSGKRYYRAPPSHPTQEV